MRIRQRHTVQRHVARVLNGERVIDPIPRIRARPRRHNRLVQHTRLRQINRHVEIAASSAKLGLWTWDPETGLVRSKGTVQGASNESAWARGQAWATYGFTMTYRVTRDPRYLRRAESTAAFILDHLPADHVPYWDYSVERTEQTPRDASAGAITASALYELADFVPANGARYRLAADRILASLGASYRATSAEHQFLLLHSTGGFPQKTEVDVPLIYADYYYVEALLRRLRQLRK